MSIDLFLHFCVTFHIFSYGSTTFSLWQQLTESNTYKEHLRSLLSNANSVPRVRVLVLGSSQGLLGMYTHAIVCDQFEEMYPNGIGSGPISSICTCEGYEVMPLLQEKSCSLSTVYLQQIYHARGADQVNDEAFHFHLQDMLAAPQSVVRSSDIVILTSLCWDDATRRKIAMKVDAVRDVHV